MDNTINFGRYCRLRVGSSDVTRTVSAFDEKWFDALDISGLRIQFDIVKSMIGAPNTATIKVYNLSESSRNKLSSEFDRVVLEAGYVHTNGVIFSGEVFNVFHRREQPDWVTEIYASDTGYNYRESYTNRRYGNGIEVEEILKGLAEDLNVAKGETNLDHRILETAYPFGWGFTGDTSKALDSLAKDYEFRWSIQTGKLYIIGKDLTATARGRYEITSESGMIGSPTLTEIGANVKTLLNWQLIPNEEIKVVSVGAPIKYALLNIGSAKKRINYGDFVVRQIAHTGDTRGRPWYSEIEAFDIKAKEQADG